MRGIILYSNFFLVAYYKPWRFPTLVVEVLLNPGEFNSNMPNSEVWSMKRWCSMV